MKSFTLILALCASFMSSACFYLADAIEVTSIPVSERLSVLEETVPVPGTEIVTLDTTLDGAMLAIEAHLNQACRPTTFETWQNYDKEVQSLPWPHWLMLGSGVAAAGAGGAVLGLGSVYATSGEGDAIRTPAVESQRDSGGVMMIVGGVVAALGVGLLTSEFVDWLTLEDSRRPVDKVIKPIQGSAIACQDGPAKTHTIMIETLPSGDALSRRVTLVTDEFGRASIDLRDPQFDDFPYGDPFALITCEHCPGWNLTLLPESAAALAIHRRDRDALTGWAETYGHQSDPELAKRVKEAKLRRDVIALGDAITFTLGSAKLKRSAGPHLDKAAEFLLKRRNVQLRIEGHTDNTGSPKKNRELSKRRADAVKRYLVKRGVPPDRLITVGMAATRPVASNRNEAGRKANRRYQFQLLDD